jgi:hypothetical protein
MRRILPVFIAAKIGEIPLWIRANAGNYGSRIPTATGAVTATDDTSTPPWTSRFFQFALKLYF